MGAFGRLSQLKHAFNTFTSFTLKHPNIFLPILTVVLYGMITIKLIKLSRKRHHIQPVAVSASAGGGTKTVALPKQQNVVNHSKETISIKLAVVLFLFLVLSFGPQFFAHVYKNYYLTYISYFNHIANPWAYYVINPTFRKDFKNLIKQE